MSSSNILLITGKPGIGKTTLISRVFDELSKKSGIHVVGFKTEEVRQTSYSGGRSTRLGFDIVLLDSSRRYPRASLARLATTAADESNQRRLPRVGQYSVDIPSFESLAVPCLQSIMKKLDNLSSNIINTERQQQQQQQQQHDADSTVCIIIDEIGKMELCSTKFTALIEQLISSILSLSKKTTNNNQSIRERRSKVVLLATVPSSKRFDGGARGIPFVDRLCSMKEVCITEIDIYNRDSVAQDITKRILNSESM
ncbi:unnamed protein product [Trichobilharzia szidati]|nr:unnamed protein product [Trichobilharzia szidati]